MKSEKRDRERILLARLFDCDESKLKNPGYISSVFKQAASMMKLIPVNELSHKHEYPESVSHYLVVEESHIGISTWPEYMSAVVYLVSCNPESDMRKGLDFIASSFSGKYEINCEMDIILKKE